MGKEKRSPPTTHLYTERLRVDRVVVGRGGEPQRKEELEAGEKIFMFTIAQGD